MVALVVLAGTLPGRLSDRLSDLGCWLALDD
jgi:hypothetical protein